MQYVLDHNFQRITETEGTLQNVGTAPVEIATEESADSGLILAPTQILSFSHSSIYVRSCTKNKGIVATEPIKLAGGGASIVEPDTPITHEMILAMYEGED